MPTRQQAGVGSALGPFLDTLRLESFAPGHRSFHHIRRSYRQSQAGMGAGGGVNS